MTIQGWPLVGEFADANDFANLNFLPVVIRQNDKFESALCKDCPLIQRFSQTSQSNSSSLPLFSRFLHTTKVLETCVKNCGRRFHLLVTNKDFVQELVKLIGPKNDPPLILQTKVSPRTFFKWVRPNSSALEISSFRSMNFRWTIFKQIREKLLRNFMRLFFSRMDQTEPLTHRLWLKVCANWTHKVSGNFFANTQI